jgi:integrase
MARAARRRAGMEPSGLLHELRHTFGAHHAMAGMVIDTLEEPVGHRDVSTPTGCMHPSHRAAASAGIESWRARGDIRGRTRL